MEDHMREYRKNPDHLQAKKRGLEETSSADALILVLQPPELLENKFLFNLPSTLLWQP